MEEKKESDVSESASPTLAKIESEDVGGIPQEDIETKGGRPDCFKNTLQEVLYELLNCRTVGRAHTK